MTGPRIFPEPSLRNYFHSMLLISTTHGEPKIQRAAGVVGVCC